MTTQRAIREKKQIHLVTGGKIQSKTPKTPKNDTTHRHDPFFVKDFLAYLQIERNASPHTLSNYGAELEKFASFLQWQGILDIRKVDILLLRKYLLCIKERRNLGNRTIALKIATFRSYFKFLRVSEMIKNDPSLKLTTPRFPEPHINYLTKDELLLFLSLPDGITPRFVGERERDKVIFHLLVFGGLRRAEILGLKWQDINLSSGWMMVRRAKGNKTRSVPLAAPLEEALKQLRAVMRPRAEEFVLLDQKRRPISVSSFYYNIFNRYVTLSGISRHVTPHSFRHSCATALVKNGESLPLVQEILGHSNITTTSMYIHVENRDLKAAVDRLLIQ